MKQIIFLFFVFLFSFNYLFGQVDDGIADCGSINWSDPIYSDFFLNSCPVVKSVTSLTRTSVKTIAKKWYQDSAPWGSWPYGDGVNSCGTFASTGCYLTCYAMMLTDVSDWIDPWSLNTFIFKEKKCYNGCGMSRGLPLDLRPTPKLKYGYEDTLIIYTRIKATLDKNGYVIAHVNGSGSCSHWILVYAYENLDGKDVFYTVDPTSTWDESKHDLSKYNVCGVRYFVPIEKTQVKNIVIDGISKKQTTTLEGRPVTFTWTSPFPNLQKSVSTCEKKLWVVKNSSGTVIDNLSDADLYSYFFSTAGTYYVSFAINNENGFDGESVKVVVNASNGGGTGGGGGIPRISNDIQDGFEINGVAYGDILVCKDGPITLSGLNGGNLRFAYNNYDCGFMCGDYWRSDIFISIFECNGDGKNYDGQKEYMSWFVDDYQGSGGVIIDGLEEYYGYNRTYSDITKAAKELGITLKEGKFYRLKVATDFKNSRVWHGWVESPPRFFYVLPSTNITIQNANVGPANYQIKTNESITINNSTINSNFKAENSTNTNTCPINNTPF